MKERVYHIGRSNNSNDIFIVNESVSTSHAQVIIDENNDLIIIDLESKNGVFVNGDKIVSPVKIYLGDTVTLGNFKCTHKDIQHAIKIFDYKNNQDNPQSVPLKSSILKQKKVRKKRKLRIHFGNPKIWIWVTLIIVAILLSVGIYYHYNQNDIKKKFNKKKADTEINSSSDESVDDDVIIDKKETKQRTDIKYDFSCLSSENDGGSSETLIEAGDYVREMQNNILNDINITVQEEQEFGDKMIKEMEETHTFINSGSDFKKINSIMNNLVSRLANPRGFNYEIYLYKDNTPNIEDPNAFTLGGRIIITTDMFNFCKNDSELASVIAHEISHNELGHITLSLKKYKAAQEFGELGEIVLQIESGLTSGFNQKQETEADLFGIDLVYPTSYKSCSAITLWNRMAKLEGDFNVIENFMRSHPYSKSRAKCISHHLEGNYEKDCE